MSASPPPPAPNAGASGPSKPTQADIFGGSDSELSDSDDDAPVPRRNAFPPRQPAPAPAAGQANDEDDDDDDAEVAAPPSDDDDDDDDDRDGAYAPDRASMAAKLPKFKKNKKREEGGDEVMGGDGDEGEGEGEDGEGEGKKRKKKRKQRSERRREEVDEGDEDGAPVMDEAALRRKAREEQIDNAGRTRKPVRRRKKNEEDVADTYYDEICAALKAKMHNAAVRDIEAVTGDGTKFATAKLAMLDEVMAVLRNATLWQAIVDSGILEEVRLWLEPIDPTRDLPAVGIQNAMFEVFPKLDIDTNTLKESRLGPVIMFYTKTKRVTPSIRRAADDLIQAWSRPIMGRPTDFRSRRTGYAAAGSGSGTGDREEGGADGSMAESGGQSQGNGVRAGAGPAGAHKQAEKRRRFDSAIAMKENEGRKGARMPQVRETAYEVVPESRTQHYAEDLQHVSRIQTDNRKFNKFARQLRMGGKRV